MKPKACQCHQVLLVPGPEELHLCVVCFAVVSRITYGKAERLSRPAAAAWALRLARHQFGRFTREDARFFVAGFPAEEWEQLRADFRAFDQMLELVREMGAPPADPAADVAQEVAP